METTPLTGSEQICRLRVNLIGQKFGRLEVLNYAGRNKRKNSQWLCVCDCGKQKIADGSDLQSGNTKSCGCIRIKHGHVTDNNISQVYSAWVHMKQRCLNTKDPSYPSYGW